jgi:ubiquinol oxidase
MCDDKGWIKTLMDEAENGRIDLMTFIEVAKPTLFERFVIVSVQWSSTCSSSPSTWSLQDGAPGGRLFEEEAVISYIHSAGYGSEGLGEDDVGVSPRAAATA